MGDVLSRPVTDKHPFDQEMEFPPQGMTIRVGGSAMQGWRRGMEDAHDVRLNLDPTGTNGLWNWFGVFDGHCGKYTAQFAGENLGALVIRNEEWSTGDIPSALRTAFLNCDQALRDQIRDDAGPRDGSGSTAVTCLVGIDKSGVRKVYCANAGDSRAVLSRNGTAIALSTDHKPSLETERARILRAGGFVAVGRVNGNLALSRALGDFEFKANLQLKAHEQVVSPEPEVTEYELVDGDDFIVIACDGVWDVLSSQQVVDLVRTDLLAGKPLSSICDSIFDQCLSPHAPGLGCDNMTMMIVDLRSIAPRTATATAPASEEPAGTTL